METFLGVILGGIIALVTQFVMFREQARHDAGKEARQRERAAQQRARACVLRLKRLGDEKPLTDPTRAEIRKSLSELDEALPYVYDAAARQALDALAIISTAALRDSPLVVDPISEWARKTDEIMEARDRDDEPRKFYLNLMVKQLYAISSSNYREHVRDNASSYSQDHLERLAEDSDPEIRSIAVEHLENREKLQLIAKADTDMVVRDAAEFRLRDLEDDEAASKPLDADSAEPSS
jgi:hypothetical protein